MILGDLNLNLAKLSSEIMVQMAPAPRLTDNTRIVVTVTTCFTTWMTYYILFYSQLNFIVHFFL